MRKAIDVIIQARLDSSRLPRKILMPIRGKVLIAHIVERLELSESVRNIAIATTDDSYAAIRNALIHYPNIKFFSGSKDNVLERTYLAAKMLDSRLVIRATGDNPLVCPDFLDAAVDMHMNADADLTHFLGIPLGMGVEVISMHALRLAYEQADNQYQREHVTPYIYQNPEMFKILEPVSTGLYYAPQYQVTVDTLSDLQKVRAIYDAFPHKDYIGMEDVIHFFKYKRTSVPEITTAIPVGGLAADVY